MDNNIFHNKIKDIQIQNQNIREDINDLVILDKKEALEMLDIIKQNLKNIHQTVENMNSED